MSSIIARGERLYAKLKDIDGEWKRVRTPFVRGDETKAEAWATRQQSEVDRQRKLKPTGASGPLTVSFYASSWLDKRTNKTVADDRTRIEKHVLPRIGHLLVTEVRPRHLRDLILDLKNEGALSARTIRNISGLLHTMFKSAIIDEIIKENPAIYEKGVLPKKADKDPSWRRQAIYTRNEIEQLLSDTRIPIDRRVLYALKFFTGRHSEVCRLTWAQYDQAASPLGALALDETKTDTPRLTPVHPTLAAVLAPWKLSDWENLYGHRPQPNDLIVPTRNLRKRRADESQKQLLADLEAIGLRVKAGKHQNRRGHDLRRTLITLARSDGAIDGVLKCITHGPSTQQIMDLYSSYPWETLCTEFAKLKVRLLEGKVIAMAAGDRFGPNLVQAPEAVASKRVRSRPQRDSNPLTVSLGNTQQQSERQVSQGRVVPFVTGESDLDQTMVQEVRAPCDMWLDVMVVSYKTGQTRRD